MENVRIKTSANVWRYNDIPEITLEELIFGLENVECGKAAGKDGIVTDILKNVHE